MTDAIKILNEKLDYLRKDEAIASDASLKFTLKKQIEEAEAKIVELECGNVTADSSPRVTPSRLTAAPERLVGRDDELLSTRMDLKRPNFERWMPKIRSHCGQSLKIYGQYQSEPIIEVVGEYQLTPQLRRRATQIRKDLRRDKKTNDPHGLVVETPIWSDCPLRLKVQSLDYASLCAVRETGNKFPPILSANSVVLCVTTNELVLSRRSNEVDDYKGGLHTIGGAYQPKFRIPHARDDETSLMLTAMFEFTEEFHGTISIDKHVPMFAFRELDTGFIQLAFLGAKLLADSPDELKARREEGALVRLHLDQLIRIAKISCAPSAA